MINYFMLIFSLVVHWQAAGVKCQSKESNPGTVLWDTDVLTTRLPLLEVRLKAT